MTPRYLLDTNICIYLMQHSPAAVARRFAQCQAGEAAISAITLAELEYGVECSGPEKRRNRVALDALLHELPVAAFGTGAAAAYAPVRMAMPARNRDALDNLIAAHAIALGATLVTNNVADFSSYPGLRVENWV